MTDLEKMIGNEVKELKTLYDMSEAEYDRRSEEGENIDLIDYDFQNNMIAGHQ